MCEERPSIVGVYIPLVKDVDDAIDGFDALELN